MMRLNRTMGRHLVWAGVIICVSACGHRQVAELQDSAVAVSLRATPEVVAKHGAARLRWEASNAYGMVVMPDVGRVFRAFSTYKNRRGGIKVKPSATTTYVATAWGPNGSATSSTTVTVTEPVRESLRGSYGWNHPHTGESGFQEVRFTGELVSSPGSHGETSFSILSGAWISPGQTGEVHFSKTGLRPGRWRVTAYPAGGAKAVSCDVDVPGLVRLSEAACSF